MSCWTAAAESGFIPAWQALGTLYFEGRGTTLCKLLSWFFASRGTRLKWVIRGVAGLEQDEAKAVECWTYVELWLDRRLHVRIRGVHGTLLINFLCLRSGARRKAAKGGSASAQHNMALAIERGLGGLDPDPEQAITWWEQAAAQVNPLE